MGRSATGIRFMQWVRILAKIYEMRCEMVGCKATKFVTLLKNLG